MLKKEGRKVKPRLVKKAKETLFSASRRLWTQLDKLKKEQKCCSPKNAPSSPNERSPLPFDEATLEQLKAAIK